MCERYSHQNVNVLRLHFALNRASDPRIRINFDFASILTQETQSKVP